MQRIIKLLSLLSIVALVFSCSGSKQVTTESGAVIEDVQVQAQAQELQTLIEANPTNQEYRRQLASLYSENRLNLEAMKTLEKAIIMDPNDSETMFLYGEIAVEAGDKVKGYHAYKKVLQGLDGTSYVDRIAPKFSDSFITELLIGGSGQQAFGAFSADGSRIIYQADTQGNWDIFEYNVADKARNPIVQTESHEENPAFAPDGNTIVYTSTVEDHRDVEYDQKVRDIFMKDLASGRETNLTTNGSDDWHPKYAFDGKYIAFVSERNDLRNVPFYQLFGNVFIMEADGRFQLELAHADAHSGSPSIAPGSTEDQGLVYFDSDRDGDRAIYQMDFKGENLRQITFNPGSSDVGPDVSASGDKIVFCSDRDGNFEVYMMNSDGSAQQRLTSNGADDLNPVFSPDGQKVLFHSNRNGDFDIFMMDLSTQSSTLAVSEVVNRIDKALQNLR